MSDRLKYGLLDIAARLCAVLPPLSATLYFFPAWIEKSAGATFSGTALVLMFLCMIPFWRKIVRLAEGLAETAVPVLWIAVFAISMILKYIVDKFVVISLFGLAGSVVSMAVCAVRNRYAPREEDGEDGKK